VVVVVAPTIAAVVAALVAALVAATTVNNKGIYYRAC
jgi:hypothetical protein